MLQVQTFEGDILKGVEYTWTLPQGVTANQNPEDKSKITINKIGNYKVNVTSTGGVSCPLDIDISALACATPADFLACGSTSTVTSTGTEKLKNLAVGDVFSTYDYVVSVTEVSGSEASGWTGRGVIEMSFLKLGPTALSVPLAVRFENIHLNQCYQLLAGSKVITEFDEEWGNMLSVNYIVDRLAATYGEIKDILMLNPDNKEALQTKIDELQSIKVELGNLGFSPEYLSEQTASLDNLINSAVCYVGSPGARLSNSCSPENVMTALDEAIEDPVKPLNALQKAWNIFLSNYHVNRAYAFASANNIDEADIYDTSYDWIPTIDKNTGLPSGKMGTSMQVIIYQLKKDANGNNIELKHIFRQLKKGVSLLTSSANDDLNLPWDNYWTEEGEVILNESDLSEPITDVTAILPVGGTTKVAAGVKLAGSGKKTWSVYTFMTTTGKYYGMTVDYTRRIAQHGARVIGREKEMIDQIPDKLTARGIEQMFINYGIKTKTITKQINSINPKRKERYNQAIEQGKAFLKKNYGDQYKYLYDEL